MCSIFTQTVQHLSFCLNTPLTHHLLGRFQLCIIDWSCQRLRKDMLLSSLWLVIDHGSNTGKGACSSLSSAFRLFSFTARCESFTFLLSMFVSFQMTVLLLISFNWVSNKSRVLGMSFENGFSLMFCKAREEKLEHFTIVFFLFK